VRPTQLLGAETRCAWLQIHEDEHKDAYGNVLLKCARRPRSLACGWMDGWMKRSLTRAREADAPIQEQKPDNCERVRAAPLGDAR
jgi:hypothetical protein